MKHDPRELVQRSVRFRLGPAWFSQPYARPSAVFVDELNACHLAYLVSDAALACTGAHLHAAATFFRTGSNPLSWKVASWRTLSLSETAIFNVTPSGTDCKSLMGLSL
jgi:hypothetical protein